MHLQPQIFFEHPYAHDINMHARTSIFQLSADTNAVIYRLQGHMIVIWQNEGARGLSWSLGSSGRRSSLLAGNRMPPFDSVTVSEAEGCTINF